MWISYYQSNHSIQWLFACWTNSPIESQPTNWLSLSRSQIFRHQCSRQQIGDLLPERGHQKIGHQPNDTSIASSQAGISVRPRGEHKVTSKCFHLSLYLLCALQQGSESVFNQKLNEVSQQLQKAQAQNQSMSGDLEKTRGDCQRARDEANKLRGQVSSNQHTSSQIKEMEKKLIVSSLYFEKRRKRYICLGLETWVVKEKFSFLQCGSNAVKCNFEADVLYFCFTEL